MIIQRERGSRRANSGLWLDYGGGKDVSGSPMFGRAGRNLAPSSSRGQRKISPSQKIWEGKPKSQKKIAASRTTSRKIRYPPGFTYKSLHKMIKTSENRPKISTNRPKSQKNLAASRPALPNSMAKSRHPKLKGRNVIVRRGRQHEKTSETQPL